MTPNDEPDPATPLQLATAARVSCTLLEEDIADQIRKPTALRARRLTDRCRDLWQRIDALAGRIEDQQAEIEMLTEHIEKQRVDATPLFRVAVVDTPAAMREFSQAHLAPTILAPGCETRLVIPDLPAPDFVAEEIPDHPEITPPRCGNAPPKITQPPLGNARPMPDLGVRPPGFQEVRRRMQRHVRRTDAIDRIKAARGEGEPVMRKARSNATEWKTPLKQPRPWKRFVKAVEEGRLPIGKEIPVGDVSREVGSVHFQNLQTDLIIEGSIYRIKRSGQKATISQI